MRATWLISMMAATLLMGCPEDGTDNPATTGGDTASGTVGVDTTTAVDTFTTVDTAGDAATGSDSVATTTDDTSVAADGTNETDSGATDAVDVSDSGGGTDTAQTGDTTAVDGMEVHDSAVGDSAASDTDDGNATLPDDACTAEKDCAQPHWLCWAPGQALPCGINVMPSPDEVCADDDNCTGTTICEQPRCYSGSICVDDCTVTGCGKAQMCANNGRCIPQTCIPVNDDCPAQHDCVAFTGGPQFRVVLPTVCERRSCSSSAECADGGYCVKGACYEEPGYCSPIPG